MDELVKKLNYTRRRVVENTNEMQLDDYYYGRGLVSGIDIALHYIEEYVHDNRQEECSKDEQIRRLIADNMELRDSLITISSGYTALLKLIHGDE